jgi:hypothetical protein
MLALATTATIILISLIVVLISLLIVIKERTMAATLVPVRAKCRGK